MSIKDGSVSLAKENFETPVVWQISADDGLARAIAQNYIQIKCAWCGLDMGFRPANGAIQYGVSHGICPDCIPKMLM